MEVKMRVMVPYGSFTQEFIEKVYSIPVAAEIDKYKQKFAMEFNVDIDSIEAEIMS